MAHHFNGSFGFTLTEHRHYMVKTIVINCMAPLRLMPCVCLPCVAQSVWMEAYKKRGFGTAGVFDYVTLLL